jgi:hypothetical protein
MRVKRDAHCGYRYWFAEEKESGLGDSRTSHFGSGRHLDKCIATLSAALCDGPLALGFEAPLFVPARAKASDLTKARVGECVNDVNRPFSAGVGAAVLVTALTVVPYVLAKLRDQAPQAAATLD